MKGIRGMLPHAAILCANMYYVFYGIDRVNRQMNFIDNGLTRAVLAAMCLCAALRFPTLRADLRSGVRKRGRGHFNPRALWLLASAALIAGYAVMVVVNAVAPAQMPMRGEFAKAWLLAMSIVLQLGAVRVCAIDREEIREEQASRSWQRLNDPHGRAA